MMKGIVLTVRFPVSAALPTGNADEKPSDLVVMTLEAYGCTHFVVCAKFELKKNLIRNLKKTAMCLLERTIIKSLKKLRDLR